MSERRWILAVSLAVAVLLPLAFIAQAGAVSKTSAFGFKVEAQGIRLVVDTQTATWKKKADIIPMVIFIGNTASSSTGVLSLNRGCFTLTDPNGKTQALCSLDTIKDTANYGSIEVANDYSFIRRTIEAGPNVQSFNGQGLQPGTCFYPNVRGKPNMIRDEVQIRPNGYTWALLYFPNPAGRAKGTYKLTYTDPTSKATVTVPFEIAWS